MAQQLPLLLRRHYCQCRHSRTARNGSTFIRRNNNNSKSHWRLTTTSVPHQHVFTPQQPQQRRHVQYLLDPRDIPMMKYNPKFYETVNMRDDYYLKSRQQRIVLNWFTTTNLRLYDNATLYHAAEMAFDSRLAARRKRSPPKDDSCYLIPMFLFDTNLFGNGNWTPSGENRISVRRAKFILESVLDLRQQLEQNHQSKLVIAVQDPKTFFSQLLTQIPTHVPIDIYTPNEPIRESRTILHHIQRLLDLHKNDKNRRNHHSNLHVMWDSSIYDPKYLHLGGKHVPWLPSGMDEFRAQMETRGKMQHPIYPVPRYLLYPPPPPSSSSSSSSETATTETTVPTWDNEWHQDRDDHQSNDSNYTDHSPSETNDTNNDDDWMYQLFHEMTQYTPTLQDLGYTDEQIATLQEVDRNENDVRTVVPRTFIGGETAAKARLNEYFWHRDLLKAAYTTRNAVTNPLEDSSKLSVYLAHGCISPKFVLFEIKRYRKSRLANFSTYWFESQLYKREFCKLYFVKHGEKVFLPGGPIGNDEKVWSTNVEHLTAWKNGQTGYPFVDACMRELKTTGFMSTLGRQVTAYFLTHHMSHDWRNGGDWFESQLLDLDIYSNWVNWCTLAGGTGAWVKHLCPIARSVNTEHYIKLWVPELRTLPTAFIYKPYIMNPTQQAEYGIQLGVDYPLPIIKLREPPIKPEAVVPQRKRMNRIVRKKKMR